MSDQRAPWKADSFRGHRTLRWLARLALLAVTVPTWVNCSVDARAVQAAEGSGNLDGSLAGGSSGISGDSSSGGVLGHGATDEDAGDARPECTFDADCAPSGRACVDRI